MEETPLFFPGSGEKSLFGILHHPAKPSNHAYVFCHPFAEEKLWSHLVYVNFARDLAKAGYYVFRFDFTGHGDSEGDFSDQSISTSLADIDAAIRHLKIEAPDIQTISLFGLRLGASLAALYAENNTTISRLILWDPVIDGERYFNDILRINLATQLAVYGKITRPREDIVADLMQDKTFNIDGYEMSRAFYEELIQLDLKQPKVFNNKTLIMQIGKPQQPVKPEMMKFGETYAAATVRTAHEEAFWREIKRFVPRANNLSVTSLQWLGENV